MSAAAPPQLPPFDAGSTIGALLVGTLISFILYGITNVQCYMYFGRFADDVLALKALVCVVWLFETAHVVCVGHALYFYAVDNYGQPISLLQKAPVSLAVSIVVGAIITALVQSFFAFRIWTLATNNLAFVRLIPILIWLSAAVYVVASFADTALSIRAASIPAFIHNYGWLLLGPWVINLFNDTAITLSLVGLLLFQRKRGVERTTALIDQLIKWTIETGMITSVFSILNLAFYQREPNNFIWVGIQVVKARLFANSFLASLNSRQTLRDMTLKDSRGTSGLTGAYSTSRGVTTASLGHFSAAPREDLTMNMTVGSMQLETARSEWRDTWPPRESDASDAEVALVGGAAYKAAS